jgi:hypothetical protein
MLIADSYYSRHADAMGRDPAERTVPDLFPTATASAAPAPMAATESKPRRYVLPKNLRNAVKHLGDGELELMYAATLEELKHRGKTPKSVETNLSARPDLTKIQSLTAKLKAADVSLTRGSNESRAVRFQSRHNAVANRPRVRNRPSRCAAGSGA